MRYWNLLGMVAVMFAASGCVGSVDVDADADGIGTAALPELPSGCDWTPTDDVACRLREDPSTLVTCHGGGAPPGCDAAAPPQGTTSYWCCQM